jgi:deoxycytidine triphosphate deaminase
MVQSSPWTHYKENLMYGNKLSNAHVRELVQRGGPGSIQFLNFDQTNLKLSHYRLRPADLWRPTEQKEDGSHRREHVHNFSDGPYKFEPYEYLIVTTVEQIVLPEGMTGEVLGASTLIEQCFGLTAGKLDPGYGSINNQRQAFIMGLQNLLGRENWFYPGSGVANISFFDFHGTRTLSASFTEREARRFADREARRQRADDDGVFYEGEDLGF